MRIAYNIYKDYVFNVHGSVHRNNILIYIQQDATLHSLFYLETALLVSERKQYLQHLVFVTLYWLQLNITRMQSLPPTIERQQTEWKTIKTMAQNNFPEKFIKNLNVQMQQKVYQKQDKDENKQRATFTYCSPKIIKLTILFKHTNINIAFKSTNTIQQYTKPNTLGKKPGLQHRRNIPTHL
jgi:hypothetical protein